MDWIEVTARSVDDAKELALDRLGVVEEELEYEILDEPKGGLFGLGRADARIRARVKPLSRDKPTDRRRRGKGRSDRPSGSGGSGSKRAPRPEAQPQRRKARRAPRTVKAPVRAAAAGRRGAGAAAVDRTTARHRSSRPGPWPMARRRRTWKPSP